jgi:hypothetical protein
MGLHARDLFKRSMPAEPRTQRPSTPKPAQTFATLDAAVASLAWLGTRGGTWRYQDRAGAEVMVVVRFDKVGKKEFRPFSLAVDGWRIRDPEGLLPLYRLPELLASTGTIFLVEGEKCCAAAVALGLNATTSSHGSSSARKSDWSPLAGCEVVILPDEDDAGAKYARDVAGILSALKPPATVRMVKLPDLRLHEDIVDHIARRRGEGMADAAIKDEVERLAVAAEVTTEAAVGDPDGLTIVCASDVQCGSVQWLWPDRIPAGKVSLIVGDPGLGKSMLALALMPAIVSRGWSWPDGAAGPEVGTVLILSAEDAADDTIVPRLKAAGANTDKVFIIEGTPRDDGRGDRLFNLTQDVYRLERAIVSRGDVRLVCIDPVSAFLGGESDSHKDADVRAVLAPLAKLAEKHGVAVLAIMHLNKAVNQKVIYRSMGSVAFNALARAVWMVIKHPEDGNRRVLTPVKLNLCVSPGGLVFSIVDNGDGPTVCFEPGRVDIDPDEVDDGRKNRESPALAQAVEFLTTFLADGPRPQKDVDFAALAQGISPKGALRRAKGNLGVKSELVAGQWVWRLPSHDPAAEETQGAHDAPLAHDAQLAHLARLGPDPACASTGRDEQGAQGVHGVREGQAAHLDPAPPPAKPKTESAVARARRLGHMVEVSPGKWALPPDDDEAEADGAGEEVAEWSA